MTPASAAGSAPARVLEWDSEHFGFPIAQVEGSTLTPERVEAVDRWCRERGIRCLYLLAACDHAETGRLAFRHGYRLVDVRVIVRHAHDGLDRLSSLVPDGLSVREGAEEDRDWAMELAARSHRNSRFYSDGNFPLDRCDDLYRAWIARALDDPERTLRIAELDGERAGYYTLAPYGSDRVGSVDLLAVEPDKRGRGVAIGMRVESLRLCASWGATSHASTRSGRNLRSARYLARLGFQTETVAVWHHKWFGGGEA